MKNLFLALAAMIAISTEAYAATNSAAQCVPTKTIEQAKADYDAGVAAINAEIQKKYSQAVNDYNKAVANNLTVYNQQVAAIDAAYSAEVKKITTDYAPGWQDALKAARQKRDNDVNLAVVQYDVKNKNEYAVYNQTVAKAQADYNTKAKAIADEYNKSVCAQ